MVSPNKRLRLVSAFRKWDTDHDGFICEADLRRVLQEAEVPEDKAETIFKSADTDGDGRLDYEEFVAWVFSGTDHAAKVEAAAAAAGVPWPKDPCVVIAPRGSKPEKVKLAAPVPCKESGVEYWSVGGPAKTRVRVVEDAGVMKLGKEFTVAVRFRVSSGVVGKSDAYETLLMGHDGLHWLAVACEGRRLCSVSGKTGKSCVLDHAVQADEWATVFLQPRGNGTAAFAFDGEGLMQVGELSHSLVGSSLEKLGWADGVVDLAEVLLWPRLVTWREMCALQPPPPPPMPPKGASKRLRRSVRGQVVDVASGRGVPEMRVSWPKGDCCTDEDGCFEASLSDAETEVPEEDGAHSGRSSGSASSTYSSMTVLSFAGAGYAPTSSVAMCPGGCDASLRVAMRRVTASAVMDISEGGQVVDKASGSSLSVAAGSLTYADGSPIEGPVTVSLSVIDVTDPAALASMPGDFSAVGEGGAPVFLQSLGAAWIGASDAQGREVTVKEGSDGVTLDLKTKATANAEKLGADAEMWSFNDATGKWELLETPMRVDGQLAPNSAARGQIGAQQRKRGGKKKKGGYEKKKGRDDDAAPPELIEGCMSPEAFRQQVAKEGEKTVSTNLTKLGYINCDLAYHHPQRAVMLTGVVLGAGREPLEGTQLWSVGRDYSGRCPDVAKDGGKFGAMIAQFDSEVDVEVHVNLPGTEDDKVAVYVEDWRTLGKLDKEADDLLCAILGRYTQEPGESSKVWAKKRSKDGAAKQDAKEADGETSASGSKIEWCEKRHQWQAVVNRVPCFVKDAVGEGDEAGLPFGSGWRPVAPALAKVPAPVFARPHVPMVHTFGPFKTGPPGEFVDVGELVVAPRTSPAP
eukprot:CAMPEP_0176255466 /NCGR_PEP_ID=MMETSP0121_2-20121125/37055_1 /TAXON_ID=160619 /ORGANISM="Kryptoperidinium foliaceum, Strain CCMP 1326" /LENGTH=857 /DNA_ID=CAMNT_0017595293 /DNA_START=1 /DNA_END=2574 /DNA_ORIENTATION=+